MTIANEIEKIITAQKLFEELSDEKYTLDPYKKIAIGDGMVVICKVMGQYWRDRYLVDVTNKRAYEFMDAGYNLCTITLDDIDWEKVNQLDEDCIDRAKSLRITYPSSMYRFDEGIALFRWQLHPDGRYYEDEDGYGMTDDVAVNIYGVINREGKVLVKLHPLAADEKDSTLLALAKQINSNH